VVLCFVERVQNAPAYLLKWLNEDLAVTHGLPHDEEHYRGIGDLHDPSLASRLIYLHELLEELYRYPPLDHKHWCRPPLVPLFGLTYTPSALRDYERASSGPSLGLDVLWDDHSRNCGDCSITSFGKEMLTRLALICEAYRYFDLHAHPWGTATPPADHPGLETYELRPETCSGRKRLIGQLGVRLRQGAATVRRGTFLGLYRGDVCSAHEERAEHSGSTFSIFEGEFLVDPLATPHGGIVHVCNDVALNLGSKRARYAAPGLKVNAVFATVVLHAWQYIVLVAIQDINALQEVAADYGALYRPRQA
jgi:hypothetical protein